MGLKEGATQRRSINAVRGPDLGLDLAHAAADPPRSTAGPVSYTVEAVAAMGPIGAMIGTDLRISMWSLIREFALRPLKPALLETLESKDLPASQLMEGLSMPSKGAQ